MSKPTKPKNPLITCQHCKGEGMVPMSDTLLATLKAAKKLKRITAPLVTLALGFVGSPTAINNRLDDLKKMGFFTRKRDGNEIVYTPIKY